VASTYFSPTLAHPRPCRCRKQRDIAIVNITDASPMTTLEFEPGSPSIAHDRATETANLNQTKHDN